MDNSVENGQVTNSSVDEEKAFPAGTGGHSLLIKALKGNSGIAYIGAEGKAKKATGGGYPLSAGDSVLISVKNAQKLFYSFDTKDDRLAWLMVGP